MGHNEALEEEALSILLLDFLKIPDLKPHKLFPCSPHLALNRVEHVCVCHPYPSFAELRMVKPR